MTLKKLMLILPLLFILFTTTAHSITITTEPKELLFENILSGRSAEQMISIKTDSYDSAPFYLSSSDALKEWINFEPASGEATNTPIEIKIKVKPPPDAIIGTYEGYIIISTTSRGAGITTAVVTSVDLKTTISLTEDQIEQIVVKNIIIEDTEITNPLNIIVSVQNQGNIELSPHFRTEILDSSKNRVLASVQTPLSMILPSATENLKANIPNNLAVGKYWARTTVFLNGNILRKDLVSFDILRQGAIPKKELGIIKVYPDPVPLSADWVMIIVWTIILIFIVQKIAKKRGKNIFSAFYRKEEPKKKKN